MRDLAGQTALVTGGASGLGKAIAERLKADGAAVAISDVQEELGRRTAHGGGFTFFKHNVGDEREWSEVLREIEARFGGLNILVNNAGILGPMASVNPENTSLTDWRRIFAVNVEGVFLGCRTALGAIRRAGGGSIVNVSSVGARQATPFATAYGASKAAVCQLTRSVAQYCAQERLNIRCNAVLPGVILTPLWLKMAQELAAIQGISTEEVIAQEKREIPLQDFTRPEDVAGAVSYLVSPDAHHVTGAELIVDGGIMGCDTYRVRHS